MLIWILLSNVTEYILTIMHSDAFLFFVVYLLCLFIGHVQMHAYFEHISVISNFDIAKFWPTDTGLEMCQG